MADFRLFDPVADGGGGGGASFAQAELGTSTQNITDNTTQLLDLLIVGTAGTNLTVGTNRITFGAAGYAFITGGVNWTGAFPADGQRGILIEVKNSSNVRQHLSQELVEGQTEPTIFHSHNCTLVCQVASGDYVELYARLQNRGADLPVQRADDARLRVIFIAS